MTSLIESIKKGQVMTKTLHCETDFPRVLKDNMKSLGYEGEVVYKGFPFVGEGQEYWWVQLHIYKSKGDDHKTEGCCMYTNPIVRTSFFDSARSAAWEAIECLGKRLQFRLHNTQKYLDELKEIGEEIDAQKQEMDLEKDALIEDKMKLDIDNMKLEAKIEHQEAQILELQAQCTHLLEKENESTNTLKTTVSQLRADIVYMALELCNQEDLIRAKDAQIASMKWEELN